jgi:hypothetical protein
MFVGLCALVFGQTLCRTGFRGDFSWCDGAYRRKISRLRIPDESGVRDSFEVSYIISETDAE